MSVKSKNGRLAARVLVALAALFAMIALTGSACLAEGPPLGRNPQGAPAPVGGTVISSRRCTAASDRPVRDLYALSSDCAVVC